VLHGRIRGSGPVLVVLSGGNTDFGQRLDNAAGGS
jgi:hypothetical protein